MVARPWVVVVLLGALSSLGAQYQTKNFIVEAPSAAMAERIGQWAEYHRKQKAIQWLGKEMPTWPQRCPLKVKVTYSGSGGATSFAFDRGRILSQEMEIQGTPDRLVYSVLPHEVTHTVLAHHFRQPVPRWADEGGAVLSEDEPERKRHDTLVRQILNTPGRAIPLNRLFQLKQYPRDVMVLYAEGYSVTNFLVGKSSRQAFLNFVAQGMRGNWDDACKSHYGYRSVNELEQAWMKHLKETTKAPAVLASNTGSKPAPTVVAGGTVRRTLPPAMPVLGSPRPIVRGMAPETEEQRFVPSQPTQSGWAEPASAPASKPGPLPLPRITLGAPRPIDSPGSAR